MVRGGSAPNRAWKTLLQLAPTRAEAVRPPVRRLAVLRCASLPSFDHLQLTLPPFEFRSGFLLLVPIGRSQKQPSKKLSKAVAAGLRLRPAAWVNRCVYPACFIACFIPFEKDLGFPAS